MNLRKYSLILLPALLVTWFVATMFIDMMAVPLVFQNISSRDEAALVGVGVFKRFNNIELIVFLLSALLMKFTNIFSMKDFLLKLSYLAFFPFYYFFFLTNKIVSLNAKKMNEIDYKALELIQIDLDFYHQLYVRLDSIKIILILISVILIIRQISKNISIHSESK